MSFVFPSWETAFSPEFHEDAKKMLEGALNKVCHRPYGEPFMMNAESGRATNRP
jgi:hypothetical protein